MEKYYSFPKFPGLSRQVTGDVGEIDLDAEAKPDGLQLSTLDRVIKETIESLEKGKGQIFSIAEAARDEYRSVQHEVERLKEETAEKIHEVDILEKREYQARVRLMEVSRDFNKYSEDEVKEVYDRAREVQIALSVAREGEVYLRRERDNLQRRLKALELMTQKAEVLASQVEVAMSLLSGNRRNLATQVADIRQRRDLGLSIIRAQEEERRRVAREIHDGPAQLLANVVMRIDVCQKLADSDLKRLKSELSQLKDLIRESLQDVRKIIFDLRPMALDDLGLVPAMRSFMKEFQDKSGLEAEVLTFGEDRRFSATLEVALFRLAQEAINNVWKHSQAKKVTVKIEFSPSGIRIVVSDDGKGFDVAAEKAASRGNRFGLISMRERAELLHGRVKIESQPGAGTRVIFTVPLPEDESYMR